MPALSRGRNEREREKGEVGRRGGCRESSSFDCREEKGLSEEIDSARRLKRGGSARFRSIEETKEETEESETGRIGHAIYLAPAPAIGDHTFEASACVCVCVCVIYVNTYVRNIRVNFYYVRGYYYFIYYVPENARHVIRDGDTLFL